MITLYSKPNCPHCVASKGYLQRNGIEFREVNVTEDADALAFIKDRGHKTVPQLYVGAAILVEGGNSGLQRMTPEQVNQRVTTLMG